MEARKKAHNAPLKLLPFTNKGDLVVAVNEIGKIVPQHAPTKKKSGKGKNKKRSGSAQPKTPKRKLPKSNSSNSILVATKEKRKSAANK